MWHPTYKALAEVGKAEKTIFLCDYLGSRETQYEVNDGLQLVENWNSKTNSFATVVKASWRQTAASNKRLALSRSSYYRTA